MSSSPGSGGRRNLNYYIDAKVPDRWQVLIDRVEQSSALGCLIRQTADSCRLAIPPEPTIERDLIDVPIYTEAEYTTILNDFRRRLEVLVSYAEQVGAMPILILPPGNDRDFEPNRSFLPATTMRDQRATFRRDFLAARQLEATDPVAATKRYRALLGRQPGFAETHFRLARLLEQLGVWEEAFQHYADGPQSSTAIPCAASQRFIRPTARWHRGMVVSSLTGNLTFMRSAGTGCSMRACFRTRCTPRSADRSPWRKRS